MEGVYSVAEVVDDSNKRPDKTIFVTLQKDGDNEFSEGQWKSLCSVASLVKDNGALVFDNMKDAATSIANSAK